MPFEGWDTLAKWHLLPPHSSRLDWARVYSRWYWLCHFIIRREWCQDWRTWPWCAGWSRRWSWLLLSHCACWMKSISSLRSIDFISTHTGSSHLHRLRCWACCATSTCTLLKHRFLGINADMQRCTRGTAWKPWTESLTPQSNGSAFSYLYNVINIYIVINNIEYCVSAANLY